ncbi:MAG: hypothetical protein KC496_04735 [Anaerolineae bacterium]|nr:hypothetical protein [Anaerolineae bacterium]
MFRKTTFVLLFLILFFGFPVMAQDATLPALNTPVVQVTATITPLPDIEPTPPPDIVVDPPTGGLTLSEGVITAILNITAIALSLFFATLVVWGVSLWRAAPPWFSSMMKDAITAGMNNGFGKLEEIVAITPGIEDDELARRVESLVRQMWDRITAENLRPPDFEG